MPMPGVECRSCLYMQALAAVGRHFPDVWLQFALWHSRTSAGGGGKDAALAVLDRGSKVLPHRPPLASSATCWKACHAPCS